MDLQSRKGYQCFSGAALGNHCGAAFLLPLLCDRHRGDSLSREQLSKQSGEPWRYIIVRVVQRRITLKDTVSQLGAEYTQISMDRVRNRHGFDLSK